MVNVLSGGSMGIPTKSVKSCVSLIFYFKFKSLSLGDVCYDGWVGT